MRKLLVCSALLLVGCISQTNRTQNLSINEPIESTPKLSQITAFPIQDGGYFSVGVTGDFSNYPELYSFIDEMVLQNGFDREYLNGLFSQAKRKQWTLNFLNRSDQRVNTGKPSRGSWSRYLAKFMKKKQIHNGAEFWHQYQYYFEKAHDKYGVPPEYILGILAVETKFGGFVGNHRVLDALTTLAFDYSRRSKFFRDELKDFLIMAGREGFDPAEPIGSYAGAMGLGQFMPSSYLRWAIDFNQDGVTDLWNPIDAIGSVANYFAQHGWEPNQPVVTPALTSSTIKAEIESGFNISYTLDSLNEAGIHPGQKCECNHPLHFLRLSRYKGEEYWLGHPNFYVITRYNHSTFYAMAVHEMAKAIKEVYQKEHITAAKL